MLLCGVLSRSRRTVLCEGAPLRTHAISCCLRLVPLVYTPQLRLVTQRSAAKAGLSVVCVCVLLALIGGSVQLVDS